MLLLGSFPGFLKGMKGTLSAMATGAAKQKPRHSENPKVSLSISLFACSSAVATKHSMLGGGGNSEEEAIRQTLDGFALRLQSCTAFSNVQFSALQ